MVAAPAPTNIDNIRPQVINYYDHYDIPGLPYIYSSAYSKMTKGMLTATKIKVLGTANHFLWTVNYYDDEGRVIKLSASTIFQGLSMPRIMMRIQYL